MKGHMDLRHKLAAILSADIKGYSRLMGDDKEVTVGTITAYREGKSKQGLKKPPSVCIKGIRSYKLFNFKATGGIFPDG
jgi:hypothetical protein